MIQRQYWALTEGKFQTKKTVYKDKIGRDRHDRRKRVVDPRKGQSAYTTVTRLKTFEGASLVNCQLKTGRTHQIRVHLSHHGHAILGTHFTVISQHLDSCYTPTPLASLTP